MSSSPRKLELPASPTDADAFERDYEIANLEQRTATLEAEIARRTQVEATLAETYKAERSARHDAEQRELEGDVLFRLSQMANGTETADAIFQPALDALCTLLSIERAAILLLDDQGVMRFQAAHGLSVEYRRAVEGHSPWQPDDIDPWPVWITDVTADADLSSFVPLFKREEIGSLGFIPLVQQGKLLGKFMAYDAIPRVFSPREKQLAVTVAAEVAQAVARGRLIESQKRSWQQAEDLALQAHRLHAITAALSQAASLEEVCRVVVSQGVMAVAGASGGLWLMDEETQVATLITSVGYSDRSIERFKYLKVASQELNPGLEVLLTKQALWVESRRDFDARFPALPVADNLPELAVAMLPLLIEGRCIGVLSFTFDEVHTFPDEERVFLFVLAQHCAQAVERSRLFERERRARTEAEAAYRRAGFLLEASALLSSSLDFTETLNRLASLSVPRVADWCLIDIVPGADRPAQWTVAHVDETKAQAARDNRRLYPPDPDAEKGAPQVMRTCKAELYEAITDDMLVATARDAQHLQLLREAGMCSAVIAPIVARGHAFGTITFVATDSGRHYGPADLDLAELLGRRAGIAIDNALLYEAAQAATRAREEVLAVVSHDLRTPLGVVMMGSQFLMTEDQQSADAIKSAEMIRRASERMGRLIEDLLDFASIEARRFTVERRDCSPREILSATVEMLAVVATDRRLTLTFDLPSDAPKVCCDRDRMIQVLVNLTSNALQVTARGGAVSLGVEYADSEVVFFVKDTGPGIEAAELERVFDRYWRGSQPSYRGNGLGLAIAKGIADAHGGRIWAESEVGVGSRFAVAVPR